MLHPGSPDPKTSLLQREDGIRAGPRRSSPSSEAERPAGTGVRCRDEPEAGRTPVARRRTYVLIDGENIDATLGGTVLGRKPEPNERPRWERVLEFARGLYSQETTGLFFLNASNGYLPGPFVSALQTIGFRPVPLAGQATEKVVDIGIQRTLEAIAARDADVLLGSHDRDYLEQVTELVETGHRVAILGFPELVSGAYAGLDVRLVDLETEVRAFNVPLPRVRIIPLPEFDPEAFLH
jgi:uncharacterized protein